VERRTRRRTSNSSTVRISSARGNLASNFLGRRRRSGAAPHGPPSSVVLTYCHCCWPPPPSRSRDTRARSRLTARVRLGLVSSRGEEVRGRDGSALAYLTSRAARTHLLTCLLITRPGGGINYSPPGGSGRDSGDSRHRLLRATL
jgi:hypothetical protein